MNESRGFASFPVGGGWLVDEVIFRRLIDFEIPKAQRLRYSVSLVCFALEQPMPGDAQVSSASLAENVARHLRRTDAVASWSQGWLALLLVAAETIHLPSILHRLTNRLDTAGWSAGGTSYPRTATRTEDMLREAVDLMTRAREEGGNRLYVAS